ncbi:HAMP domain-containing sensor histidine kinase [Polaromonas sp.]|uniref:sensor histidine kinase n=1 Tax=Polaromonas sp. TaxID=1869339 RepID=UPI0025E1296F|nr:HAMP domain-containing sensor histidine kinase [Polaromonas sp.]
MLLAFVLVWAVLLGYIYVEAKQTIANNSGFQKFGHALTLALTDVNDRAQAASVVAATAVWVNIRRRETGVLPGHILFELLDRDGQRIYASAALALQTLDHRQTQLAEQVLHGETYRVYQGETPQWKLRIAEPKRSDADILAYNGRFILPYLLLALPFVVLPVSLSVRHGLRPLKELTARISLRSASDLDPVNFEARHRELKPLVHALDAMLIQLRQKVERERAFVHDAAHEIRTPMAVIAAQAHALSRATNSEDRERVQVHLEQAIARASHLTQQLLELASLDDAQRAAPKQVDVSQLVRQIIAQAAPQAMARGIDLALDAPDRLTALLDVPAFQSIVENLLNNALRYVQNGAQVAVTLRGSDNGDVSSLMLSVEDDGPGIPAADRQLVFERFYRAADTETPGSGLGLAIVKQAAIRMGGSVAVSSGLKHRGAGFHVSLPLARQPPHASSQETM